MEQTITNNHVYLCWKRKQYSLYTFEAGDQNWNPASVKSLRNISTGKTGFKDPDSPFPQHDEITTCFEGNFLMFCIFEKIFMGLQRH